MPRRDLQAEFFASMADPQAIRLLFEHLPGIFFFVKDAEGRMGVTRRYEERMASYTVREVAAVVSYLREHRKRKTSVAKLAEAVGVSERDLHRKVREALGTTPHDLMLRMRIQGAAEVLARTGSSIEKIAVGHGFCDQSAFTQQFRRRTGMTPREFRKRHQH